MIEILKILLASGGRWGESRVVHAKHDSFNASATRFNEFKAFLASRMGAGSSPVFAGLGTILNRH